VQFNTNADFYDILMPQNKTVYSERITDMTNKKKITIIAISAILIIGLIIGISIGASSAKAPNNNIENGTESNVEKGTENNIEDITGNNISIVTSELVNETEEVSQPETQPEDNSDIEHATQTLIDTETDDKDHIDSDNNPDAPAETSTEPDPEIETKAEPEVETKLETESMSETVPQTETESESIIETESEKESTIETETLKDTEPAVQPENNDGDGNEADSIPAIVPQIIEETEPAVEERHYKSVADRDEFLKAIEEGGYIRLDYDIRLLDKVIIDKKVVIDLNGYSIFGEDDLLEIVETGDLTVIDSAEGGDITSDEGTAITLSGGKLDLKDGTVKGKGYTVFIGKGYAVINGGEVLCDYYTVFVNDGQLDVNGGKLDSQLANAIFGGENSKIQIFDGYIEGVTEDIYAPAEIVSLEGGYYLNDPTKYLEDGYKAELHENGYYTIVQDIITVTTAEEFEAALLKGGTIILGANIELTNTYTLATKPTVIDLNGYTLSANRHYDSEFNATAAVLCAYGEEADLTIIGDGAVINTSPSTTKQTYAVLVDEFAKVTIKGGTYFGKDTACYINLGTAVIEGGFFECDSATDPNPWYIRSDYPDEPPCFLADVVNSSKYNYIDGLIDVIISGGTFVNEDPSNLYEGWYLNTSHVADGFTVVIEEQDNGDKWYRVVEE